MPNKRGRPRSKVAQHRVVADEIRRLLQSGEWPVGTKLPSYRALAGKYKTGIETIRLAFKELQASGHVAIEPRRVATAKLTGSFDSIVRGTIVVVLTGAWPLHALQDPVFGGIWAGVLTEACPRNVPLLILQHYWRWRSEYPAALALAPISGFLLLGNFKPEIIRQYEQLGNRTVVVDLPVGEARVNSVCVDNQEMMIETVARLVTNGHRRIAFIRTVRVSLQNIDPDSREREAAFRAACAERDLREGRDFAVYSCFTDTATVLNKIFSVRPPFTAIVSTSYEHFEQTAALASKRGLLIPRDLTLVAPRPLKLAGHDWSGPAIDFETLGASAVDLLLKAPQTPVHLRMPTTWLEGNSMGPAPTR